MKTNQMYVVTRGRRVGIFYSWDTVVGLTNSYPNNFQCKIETENQGYKMLIEHLENRLNTEGLSSHEEAVLKTAKQKYDPGADHIFPPAF